MQINKKTLSNLELLNPEAKPAIIKYLKDKGLSRQTVSQLRNQVHLSGRSIEILQDMIADLKLKH